MEYKLTHTNDPKDQCLLCPHQKIAGSDYCARHGANKQIIRAEKETLYDFQKTAFLQRTMQLAKHEDKYTLEIELGIQRSVLEQVLNRITDFEAMLRYNSQISSTIQNIRNLVNDSLKLDEKIGEMISKDKLIELAQTIVDIIVEEVDDTDIITKIVEKLNVAINDNIG